MKKIIVCLLLIMPIFVDAACDRELQNTYRTYAKDISYDTEYSKTKNKFTVTLFNVIDEMSVKYNNKVYSINNNSVVIDNISEGTHMTIEIYGKDGCNEQVRTIFIDQPYYNEYYGSTICHGYVDKITYCTHQFTSVNPTEKLVKGAIQNYEHELNPTVEPPVIEDEPTLWEIALNFGKTWGIRILLFVITALITNHYFNDKYIKIKHKL